MTDFDKQRLFDEAVSTGIFINIDAIIGNFEVMAEMARDKHSKQRWAEKAQEYKQLRADAELEIAMNNHRESGNE